jgi:hypothetical protein
MITKLKSKKCVNSLWVADWLAIEGQEHCECIVECKVIVSVSRNENDNQHDYVVTQGEYLKLRGDSDAKI